MTVEYFVEDVGVSGSRFTRELNTSLVAGIITLATYTLLRELSPLKGQDLYDLALTYAGPAWWFFLMVAAFLFWVFAALTVQIFSLASARRWDSIDTFLEWATEACPLVGLLTTFISLLMALLVYSEAGPGKPETQQAFIENFAVAFGSSICGGLLALTAFTLHKFVTRYNEEAA